MFDEDKKVPESDDHVDFLPDVRMIKVEQIAAILGVSPRTVWRLLSAGQIPEPIRYGRNVRWNYPHFKTWLNERSISIQNLTKRKSS